MNNKGLLIVVSGPSGAGKGTVCSDYMSKYTDCSLSVSATTRSPRPGEVDGKSYFFLTEEEFRNKIENHGFLEHAVFCGNYYGTPKDEVMAMIDDGRDVILEIEVQGAMQVRSHYPEAVLVFVVPPSMEELENRLRSRGTETDEVIKERLHRAKEEIKLVDKYNYVLINDILENATECLRSIITADKARMERRYEWTQKAFC